jgi:hypothetical protein
MNRWIAFTAAAIVATAAQAQEQIVRVPPADVKAARMEVTAPPDIALDGKSDRLAPGARIRDTRNLLVLSGSLVGQTVPVLYRREAAGMVYEAWILTPEEFAKVAPEADANSSPEGHKRFAELLDLIWKARYALLLR